ncbi:hypothetical protein [Aestuariibacter salexigens]|uniref:sulfotransferase-like domain-containing protein n=1 Tax=Aestuariibacter salexigens TaxID=226010 RepID=UPI000478723C|nr:hypothetical protein [Aestuariibacter salexigens]
MTRRIAMWSGPRNISTAMMRSWENRHDCDVVDEPFYAFYLNQTKSPHPMFDEILASQSCDYQQVVSLLTEGPCDAPLQYQKHMTHHMLEGVDLHWTASLTHCFLIRDPAQIIDSYTRSRGVCSAEDIGIIRQWELYQQISQLSGQAIPVIDSNWVLHDPAYALQRLCEALQLPFDSSMLSWPQGRRHSDGVWADHWYHNVEASTGFGRYEQRQVNLDQEQLAVLEQVMPAYEALAVRALK